MKKAMAQLKLDSAPQEKKEDSVVNMFPPEVWLKIFKMALPKPVSALRLVCKRWRDVFNDNYDIKAKLNDGTIELSSFFQYRRVTECRVVNFRRETELSPSFQLFQDPSVLTKLTFMGLITKRNFLLFVNQCTHVKELMFAGASLCTEGKLFEAETEEERDIMNKFLSNVSKLVITGAYCQNHLVEYPGANGFTSNNLSTLFGYKMPKLTTLVVRVNSRTFLVNDILGFIEKCGLLTYLDVDFKTSDLFLENFLLIQSKVVSTLNSLKISVHDVNSLRCWMPLIKVQRELVTLRIHLKSNGYCDYAEEMLHVIKENKLLEDVQVAIVNIKMP